jgi:RNA polymerase sporulation-specific sigma factor
MPGEPFDRDALILAKLRLVRKIARGFHARLADLDDLVSAGTIGLIQAVDTFDDSIGVPFDAWAHILIRHHVIRAVSRDSVPDRGRSSIDLDSIAVADQTVDPMVDDLWSAVAELPDADLPVIVRLYGLDGNPALGRRETGRKLGLGEKKVRRSRTRSIKTLRRLLA